VKPAAWPARRSKPSAMTSTRFGRLAWTLLLLAGEAAMAAAALDRALALNPNTAHAWMARGRIDAWRNQP